MIYMNKSMRHKVNCSRVQYRGYRDEARGCVPEELFCDFLQWQKILLFSNLPRQGLNPTQSAVLRVLGTPSSGVKRLGCKPGRLNLCKADAKNGGISKTLLNYMPLQHTQGQFTNFIWVQNKCAKFPLGGVSGGGGGRGLQSDSLTASAASCSYRTRRRLNTGLQELQVGVITVWRTGRRRKVGMIEKEACRANNLPFSCW